MAGQASLLVIIMSGEDARPPSYSNKSRGLRKKQSNLTPDDQPIDETDEAIEIIVVSEYQLRRIPSKQWRECSLMNPVWRKIKPFLNFVPSFSLSLLFDIQQG